RCHAGGHLRAVRDRCLPAFERLCAGADGADDGRHRGGAPARPHRSLPRARRMTDTAAVAATLAELMQRFRDAGTSADMVYAALRHGIVHGLLPPGTRLRADE